MMKRTIAWFKDFFAQPHLSAAERAKLAGYDADRKWLWL